MAVHCSRRAARVDRASADPIDLSMPSLPTLFLSHGAPTMALTESETTLAWRALGGRVPRPQAMLVISAHHHACGPTLTAHELPPTLHDFGGFPPALYALQYPAPGSPDLARTALSLLQGAGFATAGLDSARGIDHGVWVPLRHMYPKADVPVVSLSVSPARNARWHYELGQALAPLREQGVLIIGSGSLTHNLGALDWHVGSSDPASWAEHFVAWFIDRLQAHAVDELLEWQQSAPEARRNHPTSEHLLPLFVALGAAGTDFATSVIAPGFVHGSLAMHALQWN